MENEDNDLAVILDEIDAIPSEKELNQRVEEILKEAGGVRKIKDKTLYTFDEAVAECERMNTYSKEFWLENKYNVWDCEHYMNIRAANPKAPSDGYAIHWGLDYAYRVKFTLPRQMSWLAMEGHVGKMEHYMKFQNSY